ncbi:MAG: phosphatidylserine decarboxylase [Euryarchaeota archaeon]|nr:phosphatidylserine decarboxylase [Euryarchaeota archaeon]
MRVTAPGTFHLYFWPFFIGILLMLYDLFFVPDKGLYFGAGLTLHLTGVSLGFMFRDPARPAGPGVVSPADGKVVAVEETEVGGHALRIYLGPLDVHVNTSPADAVVVSQEHRSGGHRFAWDKDSDANERLRTTLQCSEGTIVVTQIAGAFMRRVRSYVVPGQTLKKGERLGIIMLGSRVDVELPPGLLPTVGKGERVRASQSTIARRTG